MNGGFREICKNTARSAPNLPRFSASAKEAKAKRRDCSAIFEFMDSDLLRVA